MAAANKFGVSVESQTKISDKPRCPPKDSESRKFDGWSLAIGTTATLVAGGLLYFDVKSTSPKRIDDHVGQIVARIAAQEGKTLNEAEIERAVEHLHEEISRMVQREIDGGRWRHQ